MIRVTSTVRSALRRGFLVCLGLSLAGAAAGAEAGAGASSWTPERMLEEPFVDQVAVAPGGARVAFVVTRPVWNDRESEFRGRVWIVEGDAAPTPATPEEVDASTPRWSPDGDALAYLATTDGVKQIWLRPRSGTSARRITASAAKVRDFRWLPNGRSLLFVAGSGPGEAAIRAAAARDDAHELEADLDNARLWKVDIVAAPSIGTPLTPSSFHVAAEMGLSFGYMLSGFDISPDGGAVAFTRTRSAAVNDWQSADVALLDLATGALRSIAATPRAEGSPLFSPDGRWIAYTASGDPPAASFAARVEVAPVGGAPARSLAATADERPRLLRWSADGRAIYFSEIRGTLRRISALPSDGAPPRDLDGGALLESAIAFDPAGAVVGFVGERPDHSPEVYLSPVGRFEPRQVTDLAAERPRPPLGRTELVRWTAPDGLEIEGLLTYPVGYVEARRVPLLLVVHGGPTYYFVQDSIAMASEYPIAAFAARGFAVLRANPRGSSGRGRAFRFANRGDWGGADYRDLMAGVDHVIALGVADPERLGVMGWSYGGYMSAWIVSQTRRFKAASVGAGIVDLVSFSGTSDIHDFAADYLGGAPWEKPELYVARSPLFQLAGAATPTLIQQGEQDLRVPTSQGTELYRALRRLGVETRLVLYPRQGHAIEEPKLLLDAARRNLDWFVQHLFPAAD